MSVTTPRGFRAAGVTAGLKASGRPDLALVVNDGPDHHAAAVFTGNRVEAAPVTWSRTVVADGRADAVVLNSGGANACTGAPGFQDTHRTAEHVGAALGIAPGDVVVCSTGLIGERLPMDLLLAGVDAAAAGAGRRRRAGRRRGDHDHRHRRQDRGRRSATAGRSAAWPRAPACSRPRWPRCSSSSPRMPSSTPADLDARAARGDRHDLRPGRLRRLHVDQRHRRAARLGRLGRPGRAAPTSRMP